MCEACSANCACGYSGYKRRWYTILNENPYALEEQPVENLWMSQDVYPRNIFEGAFVARQREVVRGESLSVPERCAHSHENRGPWGPRFFRKKRGFCNLQCIRLKDGFRMLAGRIGVPSPECFTYRYERISYVSPQRPGMRCNIESCRACNVRGGH